MDRIPRGREGGSAAALNYCLLYQISREGNDGNEVVSRPLTNTVASWKNDSETRTSFVTLTALLVGVRRMELHGVLL